MAQTTAFGAPELKQEGARYWVGNYGNYKIPPEFAHVRFGKDGYPDRRYRADYVRVMAWARSQEENARKEMLHGTT